MDRPTILPSIIRRAAAVIAAFRTWLIKQRCRLGRRWRRITEGETNTESLPDELLFDILVRLPANFLHDKARLVCRKWCHIIRSDAFINTHLQQYSSYGLALSIPSYPHAIHVTATQGRVEKYELRDICRNKITASCNGLVVVFTQGESVDSRSLHVLNPATKQSFLLPSISTRGGCVYYYKASIAYSAASMEYKVTLPYSITGEDGRVQYCLDIVIVGIDKSWRHVEIPPLLERFRSLFYSFPLSSEGGFLHWGEGIYCLTLNVETEIFTMSEAPIPPHQCYDSYSYCYLSTGRYLTLLVRRGGLSWEVWEMKPESGEWRKAVLPIIDLERRKCKLPAIENYPPQRLSPLGWVKYPEVLAFFSWDLRQTCICYNLETHEINTIDLPHNPWICYQAIVHRNTLVWLS